jgi:hypothetical protein
MTVFWTEGVGARQCKLRSILPFFLCIGILYNIYTLIHTVLALDRPHCGPVKRLEDKPMPQRRTLHHPERAAVLQM